MVGILVVFFSKKNNEWHKKMAKSWSSYKKLMRAYNQTGKANVKTSR